MTTAPGPPRSRAARAPSEVLLAGGGAGGPPAEPLLEAGGAATRGQGLLLSGVEGVARRADLDGQLTGRGGAAGGERVTATARHLGDVVLRVDVGLHAGTPSLWSRDLWFGRRRVRDGDPAAEARSASLPDGRP